VEIACWSYFNSKGDFQVMSITMRDDYFMVVGGVCGLGLAMMGDIVFGVQRDAISFFVSSIPVGFYFGLAFYHEYFLSLFEGNVGDGII
jgi:hypothetical protein